MSECDDDNGCDGCGEVECRCDTYDTAQRVALTDGATCSECRRRIVAGETYADHWGINDGDDWDESLCLPCDALLTFALSIVSRTGMHEDNGPCLGKTVAWLTDYERPAIIAAMMPPTLAGHYLGVLFWQNEACADASFAQHRLIYDMHGQRRVVTV